MAGETGILSWLANGKNLAGLGSLLGAGGSIYGGIQQAQAAKDMIGLQNKQYEFNKKLLLADEESKKRERDAYAKAYGSSGIIPL